MANRRMLARNVSLSKKLARVSVHSALLYSWIMPFTDDYGRFEAEPEIVKSQVVPRRKDFDETIVWECLKELHEIGLIVLYEIDGERYLWIPKFEDFQTFKTDRKRKAEYPAHTMDSIWKPEDSKRDGQCPTQEKLSESKLSEVKSPEIFSHEESQTDETAEGVDSNGQDAKIGGYSLKEIEEKWGSRARGQPAKQSKELF